MLRSTLRDTVIAVNNHRMRRRKKKILADGDATANWYDDAYTNGAPYQVHWSDSHYLPVWEAICERVPQGAHIFEVGCGPAQLAQMLFDKGIPATYVGFDFSPTAVEMAQRNVPGQRFEVADAHTTDLFTTVDYDTVICTEVLEHITEDVAVVKRIPSGKRLLGTVPDFDADTHVRWFKDADEVRERYGDLFEDKLEISTYWHAGQTDGRYGTFFLMNGILR